MSACMTVGISKNAASWCCLYSYLFFRHVIRFYRILDYSFEYLCWSYRFLRHLTWLGCLSNAYIDYQYLKILAIGSKRQQWRIKRAEGYRDHSYLWNFEHTIFMLLIGTSSITIKYVSKCIRPKIEKIS